MGRKFREGEITKDDWEKYLVNDFEPKNNELCNFIAPNREGVMKNLMGVSKIDYKDKNHEKQIAEIKEGFKKSTKFNVDLKTICQLKT
jgi:hypothetical protein